MPRCRREQKWDRGDRFWLEHRLVDVSMHLFEFKALWTSPHFRPPFPSPLPRMLFPGSKRKFFVFDRSFVRPSLFCSANFVPIVFTPSSFNISLSQLTSMKLHFRAIHKRGFHISTFQTNSRGIKKGGKFGESYLLWWQFLVTCSVVSLMQL